MAGTIRAVWDEEIEQIRLLTPNSFSTDIGGNMRSRITLRTLSFVGLFCAISMIGQTSMAQERSGREFRDAAKQSSKASMVFKEIMDAPDKGIPRGVLDGAQCVAVFPSVI